jgi:hypothetical protein
MNKYNCAAPHQAQPSPFTYPNKLLISVSESGFTENGCKDKHFIRIKKIFLIKIVTSSIDNGQMTNDNWAAHDDC